MYSEEIRALFEKLGIKVGDTISVTSGQDMQEGILMPRTGAGGSDIIVVKRKDGYNVGIKYKSGTKVSKLSESQPHHFLFPKASASVDRSLERIALLYTGGTIGSKVDYVSGGVYMLTKPEELMHEVPELGSIANIDVHNLMSISSEDMTYVEWQKIAEDAASSLNNGAKGVVVTLGTNTMHYTAAALSFMLKDLNSPVVLTGAMRSSDRGSSDAFVNLICSCSIAAKSDIAEVGICMHGSSSDSKNIFIRGTKARKLHTSRRDAFKPVNSGPLCYVDINGSIEYAGDYRHAAKSTGKVHAQTGFDPKVALLRTHPNSDPEVVDHYVKKGFKGLIIEGTGMGEFPTSPSIKGLSWISHVKDAVESGVIVGGTSQCVFGRVNHTVYRNLRVLEDIGVVNCEDMLSEVAYVKLGFLLGNYGSKKARELLGQEIAGEITNRIEFKKDFVE
jgi:glutamyl-tRNA(Gln) amidotransferase subunit D